MGAGDDDDKPTTPSDDRPEDADTGKIKRPGWADPPDDADTGKIHYPSFFVTNFGMGLASVGEALAERGSNLPSYPLAWQRTILFGIDEQLGKLEGDIGSARSLIRGFMDSAAIRPGVDAAETVPAPATVLEEYRPSLLRRLADWWRSVL